MEAQLKHLGCLHLFFPNSHEELLKGLLEGPPGLKALRRSQGHTLTDFPGIKNANTPHPLYFKEVNTNQCYSLASQVSLLFTSDQSYSVDSLTQASSFLEALTICRILH